jgi:hypothetical protein
MGPRITLHFFFALPGAVRRYGHDLLVEDFMPPALVTANPSSPGRQ